MKRAVCMLAWLAACGGSAPPKTTSPSGSHGPNAGKSDDGAASLAAAQGGLAALGGNGNREDSGATGIEAALGGQLHADEIGKTAPKIDGVLGEWPERVAASETLSGKPEGLKLGVAVQVDDAKIYVAAEIGDAKLARTSAHAESDEHLSFVLAFPEGRGALKAYEIGLWAGKPGESAGAVKWKSGPSRGKDVAGAKIVESDTKAGLTLEAVIPWASFAEARTTRVGMRAAFRYHDASGVIGTGPGDATKPGDLAPLPTAAETAVVDGLLSPKNLAGTAPKIDVYADVAGDERKERISVFGRFFTICGPGYRNGHQFFWREVQGELASVDTRDLEGRGKDDLVVRRRIASGDVAHEILEVWGIPTRDEPVTLFSHEIAVADGKRKITNGVRLAPKEIEVTAETATGWDAASFHEPSPEGSQALLLPWGAVRSRLFRFEKGAFAMTSEVARENVAGAAAPPTRAPNSTSKPESTPEPRRPSDLGKQVLDAYLADQGKDPQTKPRFDLEVHVDGDARAERVLLYGRELVVIGPGFKEGKGWARLAMGQFNADKDVSEVTARDLTGDGAAEILVRGVRRVTPASGAEVEIDGVFVYQVKGGTIARVFAIETSRVQGGNRLDGRVSFGSKSIDVTPGSASGWTEKTYPWPEEKPGGSVEPMLLPWSKTKARHYKWNGSTFAL